MNASTEMPRYQSHKQVWALEIADVTGQTLTFNDHGYAALDVPVEMYARYTPVAGDFYVVYADGYKSFSPRKAFLEGYTREESPKKHEGLPVKGYQPQNTYAVHEVNCNKEIEERVLRQIDILQADKHLAVDQRWLAIGRTAIEQGFMAINRAIFKPARVKLIGDGE